MQNQFSPSHPAMLSSKMSLYIFILALGFSFLQLQARALPSKPAQSSVLFPQVQSSVLPDPSPFFASNLLQAPLPTNSFFQNFVLNNGDVAEYFHPYSFRFSNSSLTLSYPTPIPSSASILQNFTADLTISATQTQQEHQQVVSSFSDLGITLDIPNSNLRFFLVKGSPYLTCNVSVPTALSISTTHSITSLSPNREQDKYTINLNNKQTWLLYSSSKIGLTKTNPSLITSDSFFGVIRLALSTGSDAEKVLDQFCSSYPVSGEALFTEAFSLDYNWEKQGNGDLLMLAHPLQVQLLSAKDRNVNVLDHFRYRSIDGDLVGVVGDSWVLRTQPIPITWHSINGIKDSASIPEITVALLKDVQAITSEPISSITASYFYGKMIAKAARLALIAEEVGFDNVIPTITTFLKNAIEPWLSGTFGGNGFLYEAKWGGLVTKNGAVDTGADFGFGIYNDHHYHIGYFLYAISVAAKLDQAWGLKFKTQAYSLAEDVMNLNRQPSSNYPRLRNFDLYNLHSWAGGLTEFGDGRNQESSSEAVNAYYSAALMGLAYGDTNLTATASLLAALEIQATQKWWHVHQGDNIYEDVFASANKITGIVWSDKRDTGLWFAPQTSLEIRVGIQVLPISPITEVLFSNVSYVKELVEWTAPALSREGVTDAWRGFDYSLEGIYNKQDALQKIKNLGDFDDGNSLTNLLWWIHSRG